MARRNVAVGALGALAMTSLLLGGCVIERSSAAVPTSGSSSIESAPVIPSELYAAQVGEAAQASRVAALAEIVQDLRAASTGGWQARQGDVTGYATEVAGGTFRGEGSPVDVTRTFLDRFGSLFGPATDLQFESSGFDDLGLATVRVTQQRNGVPVEGARLMATLRDVDGVAVLDGVRGQVADLEGVSTTPAINARQAVNAVRKALGADVIGDPQLALVGTGGPVVLVWLVTAVSGGDSPAGLGGNTIDYPALIIVDARNGGILGARGLSEEARAATAVPATDPGSATTVTELGNYTFTFPSGGRPVVIDSTYLGRFPIKVNAQQLPDGSILMLDATGPGANMTTKNGLIAVIDARQGGYRGAQDLGPVAQYPDVQAIPQDALLAMWGARTTLDLLRSDFGIASFDGANSPLPIVINDTSGATCLDNAFFLTAPGLSVASFGVPCPDAAGARRETMVTLDILAHEIGHGVTYAPTTFGPGNRQQRGLGEGIADYIGLLVRNSVDGGDSTLMVGDLCAGRSATDDVCNSWRDGEGLRSTGSGATMSDYIFLLDDPHRFGRPGVAPDYYHNNGMILTNALTESRRAIAAAAGESPGRSVRARVLDRAVLRAVTVYFTESTGLVEAAEAVLRAGADVGMTQGELSILAERLRANNLCRGCEVVVAPSDYVVPVAVSTSIKAQPIALDDRVAYVLGRGFIKGQGDSPPIAVAATPGVPGGQQIGPAADITGTIAGFGTRVVQTQGLASGRFVLGQADVTTGASQVVATDVDPLVTPAVGPDAVAWIDSAGNLIYRPDSGTPTTKALGGLTARIATGNGRVAILAADGELSVWTPANDSTRVIARLTPGPPGAFRSDPDTWPLGAMAMSGDRIAVVSSAALIGSVFVFDLAANTKTTYSTSALPLGVAVSDDFVVWTEFIGLQQTLLEPGDIEIPDTELRGYNLVNGGLYRMVNHRGVQAFPSLSRQLLVWQESANGSSDIYAARLGTG